MRGRARCDSGAFDKPDRGTPVATPHAQLSAPTVLFGIRSPLVVEYEESCARRGIALSAGIDLDGTPRLAGDLPVIPLGEFLPVAGTRFLACAFAPKRRRELVEQARALGLDLAAALVDPHAVLARTVRVGAGSFINAGVIIGAVTRIGEAVLVNRAASVGHHCLIQDYVSIGPGATLAGNIHVGQGAMIGAGAVILPDVRIGAGAIISAGAVVRAHVKDDTLVAGDPARPRPYDPKRSSLNIAGGE